MSKIIFPVEIATCSDIIYGYLAEDNDDCDYYNLPFHFRVRFLLPRLTTSLLFWARQEDTPRRDAFEKTVLYEHNKAYRARINAAYTLWWVHMVAACWTKDEQNRFVENTNAHLPILVRNAPIGTSQRRWIS